MLVMLPFENSFVMARWTSQFVRSRKFGSTLIEVAKQRHHLFATRANGGDVPDSDFWIGGKHWGLPDAGLSRAGRLVGKPFRPAFFPVIEFILYRAVCPLAYKNFFYERGLSKRGVLFG